MRKAFVGYVVAIAVIVFTILLVGGCAGPSSNKTTPIDSKVIEYVVFETEHGYGYKIYIDGKLSINQPNIPALQGTAGFESEADASRIAELAVSKIKKGIMPPTITLEELEANGIRKCENGTNNERDE